MNLMSLDVVWMWLALAGSLVTVALMGAGAYKVYRLLSYLFPNRGLKSILTDVVKAVSTRNDEFGVRVRGFFTYVIGQARVVAEPVGILHLFIFWGFLILQIETIEYLIRGFVWPLIGHPFHWGSLIGKSAYNIVMSTQDIFGMIIIVAMVIGTFRRFVLKPKHIVISRDAAIISICIIGLMVTKFIANGAEIANLGDDLIHDPRWTPFAFMVSKFLVNTSESLQVVIFFVGFLTHILIVGFFAWYVPDGKHLHLIGAMPNIFFKKIEPNGALYFDKNVKLMMDEVDVETFGVSQVEELSWKQLLDTYACTECGRCEHYCPAYNTGKPLNPMQIIHKVKDELKAKGEAGFASEESQGMAMLTGGVITKEELSACTTCGACVANCPVFIEHVDTIVDMRRYLAMMEPESLSPEVSRTFRNMESNSNPWGLSSSYRADWAQGLDIPMLASVETPPEYLFFVGCAGSFDDRQKKVTQSFAKVLKAAGIEFAILGPEEGCTGDTARRLGNEYLYAMLAEANIETFKKYNVQKIVTACPHCFHTIAKEYPQLGGNYEVVHHTELLASLMKDGRIKLKPGASRKVTYHDSCYMGRWNNSYDAPREILSSVPGVKVQEMALNKKQSFCCGAGGGRMWEEEHEGKRINIERTDQALDTDPDEIAVACPFCLTMFDDGLKNRGSNVGLKDLVEIVAENLDEERPFLESNDAESETVASAE